VNKKQLIVAWVMGIIISWICIYSIPTRPLEQNKWIERLPIYSIYTNRIDFSLLIIETIPILIIGGLLIYTLRSKKK